MRDRLSVTSADIAREFRLQRIRGSAVDAITNPAIRLCLQLGAEARLARAAASPSITPTRDGKLRAANDQD